jgi:hypothetical protein
LMQGHHIELEKSRVEPVSLLWVGLLVRVGDDLCGFLRRKKK